MARVLQSMAFGFVGLIAAIVALTVAIDPYDFWGTPRVEGLNRYRPAAGKHVVAVKLRQAERLRPAAIVAGNSRVDVGFDPGSPVWPAALRPVYNLGLPGSGTASVVDALIESADRHRPKAIFLGVDFVDFPVSREDWTAFRGLPRQAADGPPERLRRAVAVSLSLDAVLDSAGALVEQRRAYPDDITPAGFNGLGSYVGLVANEGHAALFEQRNRENLRRYAGLPRAVRWPAAGGSDDWAALDRLVAECRERGIELVLFTYPYHADLLVGFEMTGLMPAYEDWLRGLAELRTRTGVPVWVFTGIDPVTTETVPASGDRRTNMRWYWEGGHFKASLGDLMIPELTGQGGRFGRSLDATSVEATIADLRRRLAAYRAANGSDVERVRALLPMASVESGRSPG